MIAAETMKNRVFSILVLLTLTTTATSCSFSKMASNMTANIMVQGSPVIEQESDPEVAETSALGMIKTLEVFQYQNPTNKNYNMLLAKAYSTYALGFLENKMLEYQFKDPQKYRTYADRAKMFYARSKDYGLKAVKASDPGLYKALQTNVNDVRKKLKGYGPGELDTIFWAAFSWAGLINMSKDDITAVADLAMVEALMERVAKVNPHFYFGAPLLFYGVYYSSRPAMLGGSPEKGKKYFDDAAESVKGKALMPYALQAQYLAVQTMDKALFNEMIAKAEAGKVDDFPQQRLANALAKERVKFLRANEKHYFQ